MKYNYKDDYRIVEIAGVDYNIFNDVTAIGQFDYRPYVRRNTKIDIFKDLRENQPSAYLELRKLDWFQAYISDVESTPKFHVPNEVVTKLNEKDDIPAEQPTVDMSQFTTAMSQLGETISTMSIKIDAMNTNSKLEEALIEGIVSKGKELAVGELQEEIRNNLKQFIAETYGALPTKISLVKADIEYEKTGLYHKEFKKVLKLVNLNLPVMLTGGAGSGKNYMLEQVADALNFNFYYTSTITQEYKLTGFIDGGGIFHETEFYKAFTNGGVFMLDEIDASIPECLVILNGAIANGYFDFPNGREFAHEDFRVVCAGNTVGLGADIVYTGRNVLDGATLDRFVLVEVDYDERIEERLCQNEELRAFLYDIRKSVIKNKINHIIGMRSFKYSYELLMNNFDKDFIVKSVILKGLQVDDINVIKASLNTGNGWYRYVK